MKQVYTINFLMNREGLSSPSVHPRRPLTAGQRHQVVLENVKDGIQWSPTYLKQGKMKTGGRNSQGVLVSRHLGSGAKQLVRRVQPLWPGHQALVLGTQWDPGRNAPVSLVLDLDLLPSTKRSDHRGEEREKMMSYVIAGKGMCAGNVLKAPMYVQGQGRGEDKESHMEVHQNVRCRRSWLPVGTQVYDLSLRSNDPLGSTHFKAAGVYGTLLAHGVKAKQGDRALERSRLRFPSGEERRVPSDVYATVGSVACEDSMLESIGKAGKNRSQGIRPTVRGCAMNPIDHPHGGRTKGGRHEVTPWAMVAKGRSTRPLLKRSGYVMTTSRDKKRQQRVKST